MPDWRSYDDVADVYARVHDPRYADPARDLVALAGVTDGAQVLDVGTGTGAVARAAVAAGGRVTGIDPSLGMLAHVDGGLPVAAAEAIDLPFPDGAFDVVTGGFVLAHFARTETALFDMVRVTRPGGRIALSTWMDPLDAFGRAWLDLIQQVVPAELIGPSIDAAVPNRERFRRREVVEEVLHDAGLALVRTEPVVYEWSYGRDEYVEGLQTWATARFARGMLGEDRWGAFMDDARAAFAARFPDPLHDRRTVLLAVGTKG
jgi:ubiquinone/menaquinone biosynthesis C-methylase UbiE